MARTVNVTEERLELSAMDKGSEAAIRRVKGAYNELHSTINTVKNVLGALGITVGAGALLSLYHDTLKANAALDDMAESTGASVENLSKLQTVAKIGGHDFEGLAGQIGKMIKGLKGADEEGQNAGRALAFLGVQAKGADGRFRDTGEVLLDVARKLQNYEDGANKVALVQDLLGKGAERYLPFLKDLAEETGVHARLTAQQAAEAEKAEKAINRLKLSMEDARRELVISLTPGLNDFIEKMIEARAATGNLVAGLHLMATAGTGDIGGRLKEIEQELADVERNRRASQIASIFTFGVSGAVTGMQESRLLAEREYLRGIIARRERAAARAGTGAPDSPFFEFGGQPLGYESKGKEQKGLSPYESAALQLRLQAARAQFADNEFINTQLEIQAGKYGALTEAQKSHLLQLAAEREVQKDLAAQRKEEIEGREEAAKAIAAHQDRLRLLTEQYRDLLDPGREYLHDQEKLNELVRQGNITQEEAVRIQRKLFEAKTKVQELGDSALFAADAAQAVGLSFTSAMDQVVTGSGRGIRAMDLLKAAALDVAKILYGRHVTAPIAGGLERWLNTAWTGSSTGTGMTQENIGFMGEWLHGGGIAGSEGRRAHVHPAYFERAPRFHSGLMPDEMPAVLKKGEGVFTPGQMQALGGKKGSTYIIDARGADREGMMRLERAIRQLDGTIEPRAVAAVFDKQARGTRP